MEGNPTSSTAMSAWSMAVGKGKQNNPLERLPRGKPEQEGPARGQPRFRVSLFAAALEFYSQRRTAARCAVELLLHRVH